MTVLLKRLAHGDATAEEELLPLVYDDLREVAGRYLRRERPGHTLQATALVHEAYLRLTAQTGAEWEGRAHFFAVASRIMRRILVDHARHKLAGKRGHNPIPVELTDQLMVHEDHWEPIIMVDAALDRLKLLDERQAQIVEMKFFGGMTEEEIALLMGLSVRSVRREWAVAKAWLHAELAGGHAPPA